ncbi:MULTISPECIES: ATP-binding protein [unclassified Nocardioides]|uniref:ATP-binding protein n=1 Tax=unclassified Nocardioides TaxID=2615069 RepID=UPI0030152210
MSPQHDLTTLVLAEDADVFTARQLGRELASSLGLDRLDATRVATAISELSRVAVAVGGGRVTYAVRESGELVAVVRAAAGLGPDDESVRAATRLVDSLVHERQGDHVTVVVTKVPPTPSVLSPAQVQQLRGRVSLHDQSTPIEELRQQHAELVSVLEEVRAKNVELETLNRELEETNHGVMALYHELSGELERTNQGVVALYAEIDDKNDRLSAASEAKSRFLRSISHELRTPVNSVLGLTRLLTDPGAGSLSPEQAEQVGFIRTSATDLLGLVNELLDLAKAESGRLVPDPQDLVLRELFDDLANMTGPLLRDGVRLVVDAGGPGAVVHTDPDMVRHVLRNLLSNAAKFTEAGTVTLAADQDADGTTISVTDTGVGLTEEDRERVFEEFFQARTPLHATARGTGLGLPFALGVAQALGGDIEVTSTPELGSRFALRLPLRPPEPAP